MSVKKCARCKKEFTCCNEKPGCWCETLVLDTVTLQSLKKEFSDCLCKECLELYVLK